MISCNLFYYARAFWRTSGSVRSEGVGLSALISAWLDLSHIYICVSILNAHIYKYPYIISYVCICSLRSSRTNQRLTAAKKNCWRNNCQLHQLFRQYMRQRMRRSWRRAAAPTATPQLNANIFAVESTSCSCQVMHRSSLSQQSACWFCSYCCYCMLYMSVRAEAAANS